MNWLELFTTHAADAEQYAPGEWIYREGEEGTLVFVLLAGEAELLHRGRSIARLAAPDFFGETAALGEPARTDSARAATTARVLPIGPARLAQLAAKHPSILSVLADAALRCGKTTSAVHSAVS
jgi:CRP-like cAMP-binding protein